VTSARSRLRRAPAAEQGACSDTNKPTHHMKTNTTQTTPAPAPDAQPVTAAQEIVWAIALQDERNRLYCIYEAEAKALRHIAKLAKRRATAGWEMAGSTSPLAGNKAQPCSADFLHGRAK